MLNKVTIKNFQCHKDLEVDFTKGVNVIAGTSDSGKSAILKAINWVLTNKPSGIGFRSNDCKKGDVVEVKLDFSSFSVTRKKDDKTLNEYYLDDKKFVAMGNEVPIPIKEAMNIQDINIQTQFQPHYLLSNTAGEVSKILNTVCDMTIIDESIKKVNNILKKAESDHSYALNFTEKTQDEINELNWLDDALKEATELSWDYEGLSTDKQRFEDMNDILDEIDSIEDQLHEVINTSIPDFTEIEEDLKVYTELSNKFKAIDDILSEIEEIDEDMESVAKQTKNLQKEIDTLFEENGVCPLCEK